MRAAALQPSDDPAKTCGGRRFSRGTEAICASDRPASLAAQPKPLSTVAMAVRLTQSGVADGHGRPVRV